MSIVTGGTSPPVATSSTSPMIGRWLMAMWRAVTPTDHPSLSVTRVQSASELFSTASMTAAFVCSSFVARSAARVPMMALSHLCLAVPVGVAAVHD